jgi:transposase
MRITIGIDISKDTLDAYQLPDNQHIQVANDQTGHKTLVRWIGKYDLPLVVFEATGAYHRNLEAALTASDTAFAKVNPLQARRFPADVVRSYEHAMEVEPDAMDRFSAI